MKKLLSILILSFLLSGCSLIPRISFDSPGTTPQHLQKSKRVVKCKGDIILNEDGTIQSCTKGFYEYNQDYVKKERKYTIVERVRNFFNAIFGWGIWGLVIICIIFPSAFTLIGTLIGRFIEGAFGAGVQTLKRVAKAIQKTRKEGKDLNLSLDVELDEEHKQFIRQLKEKENIK